MSNILIVGANQGIGYYMVKQLLEDGNKVSVLDIQTDHVDKLKALYPENLFVTYADATDETSLKQGIQFAMDRHGTIDIAVHNACICTLTAKRIRTMKSIAR
jgi:NAD(P)-dependent dehydrogenase (short-subunit alcohol dehydrogenase family)